MKNLIEVEALLNTVVAELHELSTQAVSGALDWVRLEFLLDALPLATADYARCRNQLRNSHDAFARGETGAGRYELTLLLCWLEHSLV